MKTLFSKLINTGIKPNYLSWEIHITRKLNYIALVGVFNMLVAIVFFSIIGCTQFILECACSAFILPVVLFLNKHKNYTWATYWFYVFGFLYFIPMNLKMGVNSYFILFYFPVIISMVQLLGRKEMLKHLIILSVLCLLSVISIAIGFKFYPIVQEQEMLRNIIVFNIILGFSTTLAFTLIMVSESISQEAHIKSILKEKEILLAEVYHRVKNNLTIVTSLLSLKKDISNSVETQEALEDCRSRIYSMALVHQNIFNSKNLVELNFSDYIKNLTTEIAGSLGEKDRYEVILNTEDISLDLSNAIPCGLILNELITNSFKYAKQEHQKLIISVSLIKVDDQAELKVRDNGPGIADSKANSNSLGLELIKALSEQINGTCSFTNDNGLVFKLLFNVD